ncbi:hypothetical protein C8J56DRAFT_1090619 [Mycena floridula]|nr:hypothetical protein C8J56DRAFT_1090619 [Mycena floridula]
MPLVRSLTSNTPEGLAEVVVFWVKTGFHLPHHDHFGAAVVRTPEMTILCRHLEIQNKSRTMDRDKSSIYACSWCSEPQNHVFYANTKPKTKVVCHVTAILTFLCHSADIAGEARFDNYCETICLSNQSAAFLKVEFNLDQECSTLTNHDSIAISIRFPELSLLVFAPTVSLETSRFSFGPSRNHRSALSGANEADGSVIDRRIIGDQLCRLRPIVGDSAVSLDGLIPLRLSVLQIRIVWLFVDRSHSQPSEKTHDLWLILRRISIIERYPAVAFTCISKLDMHAGDPRDAKKFFPSPPALFPGIFPMQIVFRFQSSFTFRAKRIASQSEEPEYQLVTVQYQELQGFGAPKDTEGNPGDLYFDLDPQDMLSYAKTADGWQKASENYTLLHPTIPGIRLQTVSEMGGM